MGDTNGNNESPSNDGPFPKFDDLPINTKLKAAVKAMNITQMTEIQAKTFDFAVAGKDVVGRSRTGTGKTLAFLLPSVERLLQQPSIDKQSIQILILSPTRELALQIGVQAEALTTNKGNNNNDKNGKNNNHKKNDHRHQIVTQVVYGGSNKTTEINKFNRRTPTILVATPGRLKDHLESTTLKTNDMPFATLFDNLQVLVLDEMDRLLDMGFRREVDAILAYLPGRQTRQTLLFSATMPEEVKSVMESTMKSNYETADCIHDADPNSHTNQQVEQTHVICPSPRMVTGVVELLCHYIDTTDAEGEQLKMVVFFPTANLVAFYAQLFNQGMDMQVLEIHSRKSQAYRTKTSDQFRECMEGILFTSDVSARGVDYPAVTHVVQFGIADSRESYIHRLGRTGRAGRVGKGLLVLSDLEKPFLKKLQGLHVPQNKELQDLLNNPPSQSVMDDLTPVIDAIRDDTDTNLIKSLSAAYRSMLGFYNGKLKHLGKSSTPRLVEWCNDFVRQAGMTNSLPEIELKMARKMGMEHAEGLNLVKVASLRQTQQKQKSGKDNNNNMQKKDNPQRNAARGRNNNATNKNFGDSTTKKNSNNQGTSNNDKMKGTNHNSDESNDGKSIDSSSNKSMNNDNKTNDNKQPKQTKGINNKGGTDTQTKTNNNNNGNNNINNNKRNRNNYRNNFNNKNVKDTKNGANDNNDNSNNINNNTSGSNNWKNNGRNNRNNRNNRNRNQSDKAISNNISSQPSDNTISDSQKDAKDVRNNSNNNNKQSGQNKPNDIDMNSNNRPDAGNSINNSIPNKNNSNKSKNDNRNKNNRGYYNKNRNNNSNKGQGQNQNNKSKQENQSSRNKLDPQQSKQATQASSTANDDNTNNSVNHAKRRRRRAPNNKSPAVAQN